MTTTEISGDGVAPAWKPLTAGQRRVLGVLIEKAKTTPAVYPLTLNAVVVACNQKNNRHPVMAVEASGVEQLLDELRVLGAVNEVHESGRVAKYRHQGYRWLGVDKPEIAVMTELLLRGEQTLGELRGRAARMEPIADLAALKPIVEALIQRGLMVELTPPGRGQIVTHNLYQEAELAELRTRFASHVPQAGADDEADGGSASRSFVPRSSPAQRSDRASSATDERLDELAAQVADLRSEVESLREQIRDLESKLATALG